MIGKILFKRPLIAGSVAAALMIISAAALPNLESSSLHVFRDDQHPTKQTLNAIAKKFVNDDLLIAVYETNDVFAHDSLVLAQRVSNELAALEIAHGNKMIRAGADVLSLSTVKDAFSSESSFRMRALLPDEVPRDAASLDAIRRRAHANPIIDQNLVSPNDRVGSIIVRINPELGEHDFVRVVGLVRTKLAEIEAASGVAFQLTGHAVTEADFQAYARTDLAKFNPVVVLIALFLAFAFTRSWWSVFMMLNVVGMTQLVALGVIPLCGFKFNPLSGMIAPVAVILCASTMFHFLGEAANTVYRPERGAGDIRVAIFGDVLWPSFLCSLFTAIGFASLSVSEVQAIREFGIAATIVTTTTFVLTVIGVALHWIWKSPALFVKPKSASVSPGFHFALGVLSNAIVRRPLACLMISAVMLGVCAGGMAFLRMNENSLMYYPEKSAIRRAAKLVEGSIAGTETYVVAIERPESGAFLDPRELVKLDELASYLRKEAAADVTIGAVDYLKVMHRAFFGGDSSYYRIPDSAAQVAQLLMINQDDRLGEYIDGDRRTVRILVRSRVHDTQRLAAIFNAIDRRLAETHPASAGYRADVAGMSRVFSVTADRVARTQVESLTLSCLAIIGLIIFLFRSVSVGMASIAPNAVPLIVVLGYLGWFDVPITIGNAMVCSIAFGCAVEDTIHLIEEYRAKLREGASIEEAVHWSFQIKAPAGIWTSVVLAAGFFAVSLADFVPVSEFGFLTGLAVTAALAGNLIILPATILYFRLRFGVTVSAETTEPEVAAYAVTEGSRP